MLGIRTIKDCRRAVHQEVVNTLIIDSQYADVHIGEGAIQALRGSAIGFGTDIGGSVSMPAAFQGVFSIKPSSGRISFKDAANTVSNQTQNCDKTQLLRLNE